MFIHEKTKFLKSVHHDTGYLHQPKLVSGMAGPRFGKLRYCKHILQFSGYQSTPAQHGDFSHVLRKASDHYHFDVKSMSKPVGVVIF